MRHLSVLLIALICCTGANAQVTKAGNHAKMAHVPSDEEVMFDPCRIYHESGAAEPRKGSMVCLDSVVSYLKNHPAQRIEFMSFTDSRGSNEYNIALSQRRAEWLAHYLIRHGIDNGRIKTRGAGSSHPAVSENREDANQSELRALNRRTEFQLYQ